MAGSTDFSNFLYFQIYTQRFLLLLSTITVNKNNHIYVIGSIDSGGIKLRAFPYYPKPLSMKNQHNSFLFSSGAGVEPSALSLRPLSGLLICAQMMLNDAHCAIGRMFGMKN
jgi:hypothetical protein